ncbi:Ycf66 family protein [Prochlorococcus sp. MIT 1341]|uniref:Ycf66 family protein n=1 Tax=Prochlorococcus sp. MIT 1341 TaxID=3096221 RepID=UPI002A7615A9|nr:Ycf66 family protein [Prochlorococcus sp. MIT 1341]
MVNASLNWASIVGIVLAVCGAGLYFMRSWKPALARDYDVFFAAIGLLCGGILFFQGWRLDPILQFGQFLLAGTTVFFGYESVRLRGIAADQARRSSYFDEDPLPASMPGRRNSEGWDESFEPYERFDEPSPVKRRFTGQGPAQSDEREEDSYRSRRTSRAAIPEEAASRIRNNRGSSQANNWSESTERSRRMSRFRGGDESLSQETFGERRNARQSQRRGSRPSANPQRNRGESFEQKTQSSTLQNENSSAMGRRRVPQGSPIRPEPEDAAFTQSRPRSVAPQNQNSDRANRGQSGSGYSKRPSPRKTPRPSKPRDNNARFDD